MPKDYENRLKTLESALNNDTDTNHKIKIKSTIHTHFIDKNMIQAFSKQTKWGYNGDSSYAAYYRILIDRILPKNIDKILYLDTDMLVLCDIREIFATSLNSVIASTSGSLFAHPFEATIHTLDGSPPLHVRTKNSFCSGLMLINMQLWRKENIESKCIKFLEKYKSIYADQDALNVAVPDSISLNPSYGILLYQYMLEPPAKRAEYENALKNAKIIHCNGPAKAWSNYAHFASQNIRHLIFDKWWQIALETSGFSDIFATLHKELKQDSLHYIANALTKRIDLLEHELKQLNRRLYRILYPHKAFISFINKLFKKS